MMRAAASSIDDPYWKKVGEDLWQNLAGLLVANTIFLAWCAPALLLLLLGFPGAAGPVAALTVGPGLVGLASYAGRLARGEPASVWRESLRGAGSGFGVGAALGAVGVAAVAALRLALRGAGDGDSGLSILVFLAAASATATVVVLVGLHALGLVGLYRQPGREAFRNALLLALRHPGSTAGLAGTGLVTLTLAGMLGWGLLIIAPAALVVCATNHTLRLVRMEQTNVDATGVHRPPPRPPVHRPCPPGDRLPPRRDRDRNRVAGWPRPAPRLGNIQPPRERA